MQKLKKQDLLLLVFLYCVLLLGGLSTLLFPAKQFSEKENRTLSEMPRLTRDSLFKGDYTKNVDTYLAEHIPTKESMRAIRAVSELGLGKCTVNGVLICPNGRLIPQGRDDARAKSRNTRAIAKIKSLAKENGIPCSVCVLPKQTSLSALVPPFYAATPSAAESTLKAFLNDPAYWYRTDHHMTTAGAFALYTFLGDALHYTPYGSEKFIPATASDAFLGTSDAKAGLPLTRPDTITLYRYEGDLDYSIKKDGAPFALTAFYDMDKLQTRDGYGIFFGGNHALLEIDQGESDTRPALLVIKDSYANALLPFLALHYRLIVADPRYGAPSVEALADRADRILILCGEETLSGSFLA